MREIEKEMFIMKNFMKYAVVGVAGYLIGFYEMKYKVVKCMATYNFEKITKESNTKTEESK